MRRPAEKFGSRYTCESDQPTFGDVGTWCTGRGATRHRGERTGGLVGPSGNVALGMGSGLPLPTRHRRMLVLVTALLQVASQ